MLLPDKHITVAESLLGLGAFVLQQLDRPRSIDRVHDLLLDACKRGDLPAHHDFDSLTLAILFLFSIGTVEVTNSGALRRCDS